MHNLFDRIVNLTDELFSFVDTSYRYQEVNNAYIQLFGKPKQAYIGHHVYDVMGEEEFSTVKEKLDACFEGNVVSYEKWFDFGEKKRFYLLVMYTPYIIEEKVLGAIVSVKNRTKERLLEEERVHTKEMLMHYAKMAELGSMASFLNHQWRAPLNTLAANFLKLTVIANENTHITSLKETVQRCEEIVEQISSDLEAFRTFYNPNMRFESLNIEDAIKNVLTLLEDRIFSLDVSVSLRVTQKGTFHCNKSDFLHLMMIFFNNALDAIERTKIKAPMIHVSLKRHHLGSLVLSIEDNAGGMDKALMEKIFRHFVSTKPYKDGSGIGLFFAKLIANEKLGAQLHLKEGKEGLKVVLEIPK